MESEVAANIVIRRMSAKIVAAENERSASRVSTIGVGAKSSAEAEPTCLVDDVVGALRLYQTFVRGGVAACDDDRSMNNIVILKKVLIIELSLALSSRALDAVNGHGINLDKIYVTFTMDKTGNTCIEHSHSLLPVGTSGLCQRGCQFKSPIGDPTRIPTASTCSWMGRGTSATAALTCASDGMLSPLGRARSK